MHEVRASAPVAMMLFADEASVWAANVNEPSLMLSTNAVTAFVSMTASALKHTTAT